MGLQYPKILRSNEVSAIPSRRRSLAGSIGGRSPKDAGNSTVLSFTTGVRDEDQGQLHNHQRGLTTPVVQLTKPSPVDKYLASPEWTELQRIKEKLEGFSKTKQREKHSNDAQRRRIIVTGACWARTILMRRTSSWNNSGMYHSPEQPVNQRLRREPSTCVHLCSLLVDFALQHVYEE